MKFVSLAAAGLAGIALVLLAIIGTADVIGASFLGIPVPGTVEIGASLMVAGIALGLPLAQYARRHVRVEIFIDRLPRRARAVLDILAQLSLAVAQWLRLNPYTKHDSVLKLSLPMANVRRLQPA